MEDGPDFSGVCNNPLEEVRVEQGWLKVILFARRGGTTCIHLLPAERHDLLDDCLDGGGEVDGGVLGDVGPDLMMIINLSNP